MAKYRPPVYSLAAGEISPDMYGRMDHEKYPQACRKCRNYITRPHGSAYRRPGSQHICPAKDQTRECVLLEFDYNSTVSQSYIIEAGHNYLRFFMDGGIILGPGALPYELVTPWTGDQVQKLRFCQSSDVMYLAHGKVCPNTLIRRGHADWTLEALDFRIPGHDLAITDTNADGKADGKQGDTMVLAIGREFDAKMIVKGVTPAGEVRWFEYHGTGYWKAEAAALTLTFKDTPSEASGTLEIKAVYTSAGKLNTDWVELTSDSSAPKEWTGTNWPTMVCIHENRLWLAATPEQPLSYWASRTGYYTDFRKNTADEGEPLDDDAIWGKVTGSKANPLLWMVDQDSLFIGTNASEVRIYSGTDGEPVTPAACQSPRLGANGSSDVPGQLVGNSVLYVSRTGRKVWQLAFRFNDYRYGSHEMTLLAQHITGPGLRDIAYAVEPDGVLWAARKDGHLCGCTYLPEQNVLGWHLHMLGGDGRVESVATIPGERGDELWMVVRRTNVDGTTRRDIERLKAPFEALNADGTMKVDAREAFFVDSGLSYSGVPVAEVSGLEHLEGKQVQILADGRVHPPQVVAAGKVTLDAPYSLVHVGLRYISEIEPMPLDMQVPSGTTQAQPKRVIAATVRMLHSVGGKVAAGTKADRTYEPIMQDAADIVPGQPPQLKSGDVRVNLSSGSELDAVVCVRQDDPLPMTVICIFPEVVMG